MSDYTQITSFGTKDALTTGDPNKKILGSQIDAEFTAIASAISSRQDSGSAVLEASITDGTILARVGSNETITGTWTFSTIPTIAGYPAKAGTETISGAWNFSTAPTISSNAIWHAGNDGAGTGLDADLLDGQHGSYYTNATNISSGSLADGRLSANVALLNTSGTFSGSPTFSGTVNFSGTLQYGSIEVGFRGVPQNSQSANYTCVIGDAGKHIFHPSGGGSGDTFTIPANASVAYAVGTVLTFINRDSNSVSIAITSDTMYLAGTTTTGTRTLGQNGIATATKVESTVWIISGSGLT